MLRQILFLLVLVAPSTLCPAATRTVDRTAPLRFGVLGDSLSISYLPLAERMGERARSWMDVAVAEGLILTGTDESPNLSVSGLAAKQVVAKGRHRPLVDALKQGTVDAVLIQLGNDDLSGYVIGIASTIPPPTKDEAIAAAVVADLHRIVSELRQAGGDQPLFLCTVPDWGHAPGLRGVLKALPTGLRRRITRVTAAINDGVRRLAEAEGCVVIDLAGLLAKWRSLPPRVGDRQGRVRAGDRPEDLFLADGLHPGPAAAALMVNELLVALRHHTTLQVAPAIREADVARIAGLEPASISTTSPPPRGD